jgi:hypothetical protein
LSRCVISFAGRENKKAKERWFLLTSIAQTELAARQIVGIYEKRMRIEQSFRDQKNLRFGFALRQVRLSCPERYDRILLIAALSMVALFVFGAIAEKAGMAKTFRANTARYRTHRLFYLGRFVVIRAEYGDVKQRDLLGLFDSSIDSSIGPAVPMRAPPATRFNA